jgi:hypothetical protein
LNVVSCLSVPFHTGYHTKQSPCKLSAIHHIQSRIRTPN